MLNLVIGVVLDVGLFLIDFCLFIIIFFFVVIVSEINFDKELIG